MKATKQILTVIALLASFSGLVTAVPLGSAFTYQGRLNDGTNPANGRFDLKFTLYDAVTAGSVVGVPLTTNAVAVSNGFFVVTLDFGSVFDGNARWLDLAVKTNGAAVFTTLTPRQPLTPTPYALYTPSAGAAATANVANTAAPGSIGTAALAPGAVGSAQLASNLTVSGTLTAGRFQGSGAMPWLVAGGAAQLAAPNTGYLLTNAAPVLVTLPAAPTVGDIVSVSGLGAGGWQVAPNTGQSIVGANQPAGEIWTPRATSQTWWGLASSADGTKLAAVVYGGQIYTSADSGMTWTPRETSRYWSGIASSADGTKLVAIGSDGAAGRIYTSSDSGVTWIPRDTNRWGGVVASSADGTKLVAFAGLGANLPRIHTSTDSGVTWTPRDTNRNWISVASSADGTKLVAATSVVGTPGQIYTSTDSGASWLPRGPTANWRVVASSADGTRLVAGGADLIYTSHDSGTTWIQRTNFTAMSLACSADGTRWVGAGMPYNIGLGVLYTSSDSGATWTLRQTNQTYQAVVASSANGNRLVAAVVNGLIYTSAAEYFGGPRDTTAALQYIGNGQWQQWQPQRDSAQQIPAGAVGNPQLAPNAVTTDKIADGTIGPGDMNMSAFGTLFWTAIGNPGTTPGVHFVGTSDDQALELRANSQRALRLEPTPTSPNLIGGHGGNAVAAGKYGATIGGGGSSAQPNTVNANLGVIGGGAGNSVPASGVAATAAGGVNNIASGAASFAVGSNNLASAQGAVAMGTANKATNRFATAIGNGTTAGGQGSTAMGVGSVAAGSFSTALGFFGQANHDSTFVWADSLVPPGVPFASTAPGQFLIRASGGVGINTATPQGALDVSGDLQVSGAYKGTIGPNGGAPFPRPAYDSGWVSFNQGEAKVLTHNIGGNTDNYVVDMQFKSSLGVNTTGFGGYYDADRQKGASWFALTSSQITVMRWPDELWTERIRIRIWVYN